MAQAAGRHARPPGTGASGTTVLGELELVRGWVDGWNGWPVARARDARYTRGYLLGHEASLAYPAPEGAGLVPGQERLALSAG